MISWKNCQQRFGWLWTFSSSSPPPCRRLLLTQSKYRNGPEKYQFCSPSSSILFSYSFSNPSNSFIQQFYCLAIPSTELCELVLFSSSCISGTDGEFHFPDPRSQRFIRAKFRNFNINPDQFWNFSGLLVVIYGKRQTRVFRHYSGLNGQQINYWTYLGLSESGTITELTFQTWGPSSLKGKITDFF